MECHIKNPYALIGTVVTQQDVIDIVASALNIDKSILYTNSRKTDIIDARLLIYYEFYRKNVPISYIQAVSGLPTKRSNIQISIGLYYDRVQFDPRFRNKVNKLKEYMESINIKRNYKLIWRKD